MKKFVITALTMVAGLVGLTGPVSAQIVNGSFETGDYNGWTLSEDSGVLCFGTWGIAADGQVINLFESTFDFYDGVLCGQTSPGLPKIYVATDGAALAYQLQLGPERHRMYQDVDVGSCQTLTWDMDYFNHEVVFDAGSQFLAVHIRDPADDSIVQTLFKTTQGVDPLSIPMTNFSADISAYVGSTVRIDVDLQVQSFFLDASFDNFKLDDCAIEVDIDIKFCSNPNGFNCKSRGVTPVTVFGTEDFDATEINVETAMLCLADDLDTCTALAPKDSSVADRGDPTTDIGASECAIDPATGEPLNQDGLADMDIAFHTQDVVSVIGCDGLSKGDASPTLVLIGETNDGTPITSVPIGDVGVDQLLIQKN